MFRVQQFFVAEPHFRPGKDLAIEAGGVPWNPPFKRASLTRDTLIEQSNRYTLIEQSQ